MLEGFRVVIVDLLAAPEAFFVKLDALLIDLTKNHRGQAAVADGKRFVPVSGRLLEPEPAFIGGGLKMD
jgi:hypothetical protein